MNNSHYEAPQGRGYGALTESVSLNHPGRGGVEVYTLFKGAQEIYYSGSMRRKPITTTVSEYINIRCIYSKAAATSPCRTRVRNKGQRQRNRPPPMSSVLNGI